MQTFEIGKMAAMDEFIDRGPFLVDTGQRKLPNDLERNLRSDLSYSGDDPICSDDEPVSLKLLMKTT